MIENNLSNCTRLTHLKIFYSHMMDDRILGAFPPNLTSFDMVDKLLSMAGVNTLISHLPGSIQNLDFKGTISKAVILPEETAQLVDLLKQKPALETFHFKGWNIGDMGAQIIANNLGHFPNLQELCLRNSGISEEVAGVIKAAAAPLGKRAFIF